MREKGNSYKEIVVATGTSNFLIWNTWKAWNSGGKKAISVRTPGRKTGEKRHLSKVQDKFIQKSIIDHPPDQLKFDFALWNRIAVQQQINQ
jgi:hypothetical protein